LRSARETIPAHLRLLHGNEKAVIAAYAGDMIDDDVASPRDVLALIQANVIVENSEGVRRLSRSLHSHLDDVMRKRRSYRAGENFSGQVEMLEKIIASCEDAMRENHFERQCQLEDEFRHAAESLAQGIDETLTHLRAEVDNEFGDLPSFAEKSRQNQHYTKRVEETIDALALIADSRIVDRFDAQPMLEEQERIHRRELLDRIPKWRQAFMTISEVLGRHVHTLRRVDPEAKALRRLSLHMRNNRSYEMPDDPQDDHIQNWMLAAMPLAIMTHPDVHDVDQEDMIADVVASLPALARTRSSKRKPGILVEDDDEPTSFIIRRPQWRIVFDDMVREASVERISARSVHARTQTGTSLDIWLIYVAATCAAARSEAGLRHETVIEPHGPLDGLLRMKDVVLWTE